MCKNVTPPLWHGVFVIPQSSKRNQPTVLADMRLETGNVRDGYLSHRVLSSKSKFWIRESLTLKSSEAPGIGHRWFVP